MKGKKFVALLLLAAMVGTMLVGCGGGGSDAGESGAKGEYQKEIVIALADEFTTIDPMETTAESNQIVQDCTHDLLTDTNLTTMKNEGELVESWEMVAPDHWKFKLKSNVTFHDGTILNVDDVKFTFDRAATKPNTAAYMAKIAEFVAVDELNFEVKLKSGDVDFNYVVAANCLGILSKEAFETMEEEEAVKIGTGPWKFEEFVPGDYISLVRFDGSTLYPVPNTERLVFRMIPEASGRMIALENGEVDVIMSPSANDYSRLAENEEYQLLTETGRGQHYVAFNMTNSNSIVSDPKFREAMAYGINKEEMIIAAWDGYAQVSTNIMCRDMDYYTDIKGIEYDPEKAQALFDELGAKGLKISMITSDATHRVKMAENFQAQMAKYGMEVSVEFMQQAALVDRLSTDPSVEMYIMSWTPGKNADYMFRNPIYSTGGRNYSHINDAKVDGLADNAAAEVDTAKRAEMYTELQTYLTTELIPWVPVAQATLTMGAAKGITGILLHPGLVHQFKAIEKIIE